LEDVGFTPVENFTKYAFNDADAVDGLQLLNLFTYPSNGKYKVIKIQILVNYATIK
jgi:hypothetical protein